MVDGMKTTTQTTAPMLYPTFKDPWLNATVDAGRDILLADNDDHEPTIAAYADRLGFSRAEAREVLGAIKADDSSWFLAVCAEGRYGKDDDRSIVFRERYMRELHGRY